MKRLMYCGAAVACVALLAAGCAHIPGKCDLNQVAKDTKLQNVTTGDGTFENYKTTGYYTSTEIGLAVGLPFICKIAELVPMQDDTEQMTKLAQDAKDDGATSIIKAHPPKDLYTGFPFFFVGIYVDSADGTGIKSNK